MQESEPIRPGLYAAITSPRGILLDVDEARPELQDAATGFFAHRIGADAVVLCRGFGIFRGGERTRELRAVPPPALVGPAEAIEYAERLASRIQQAGWDLCLALALMRPTATGLCGWIVGGAHVFRLDPLGPDGAVLCSPRQTLQVPPGMALPPGLDPESLLVSGVTTTVRGGDWFAADGRRFAVLLLPPPITLPAAALDGDVTSAEPGPLLQRLGAVAAAREIALVADWSLDGSPSARGALPETPLAPAGPKTPPVARAEAPTQPAPPPAAPRSSVRRIERRGDDLIIEVQAGTQTNSGGLARATVRFMPTPGPARLAAESALPESVLPGWLRDALIAGLVATADALHVTGYRAVIEGALVHPIDATAEKFRAAGALAVRALQQQD